MRRHYDFSGGVRGKYAARYAGGTVMGNPKPSTEARLLAHLAEYSALTMRDTYWITLCNALWPLSVLALTLMAQAPAHTHLQYQLRTWIAVAAVQVIVLSFFGITAEAYNNVRYLECELRPRILDITVDTAVWAYETYLARQRPPRPMVSEVAPALLSAIALSLGIWFDMDGWSIADTIGALICVAVMVGALFTLRGAVKIRNEFSACAIAESARRFDDRALSGEPK
jgi:hypothetical protein